MHKLNKPLKQYSDERGVAQWQVAKGFGVSASTLCVWMREEFSEEKKMKYRAVVDNIAARAEA